MTVGPVDGDGSCSGMLVGLLGRSGGGLQPQLARIRLFVCRVKMFSLMTTLWIRLQGKRKLEEAISAQSTYEIDWRSNLEFVNKNLRRASQKKIRFLGLSQNVSGEVSF